MRHFAAIQRREQVTLWQYDDDVLIVLDQQIRLDYYSEHCFTYSTTKDGTEHVPQNVVDATIDGQRKGWPAYEKLVMVYDDGMRIKTNDLFFILSLSIKMKYIEFVVFYFKWILFGPILLVQPATFYWSVCAVTKLGK